MEGLERFPAMQPGGKAARGNPPLFFSYQQASARAAPGTPNIRKLPEVNPSVGWQRRIAV